MSGELAPALWGIPVVPDAASRDAAFPLATRSQNQRVYRIDAAVVERWSASAWVVDLSNAAAAGGAITAAIATAEAYTDAAVPGGGRTVVGLTAYEANNAKLNVLDFATPVGTTINTNVNDATASIQAALTAAGLLPTGADVFLPRGTYKVTSLLTIPSNVKLRGEGRDQTILQVNAAGTAALYAQNKSNVAVEDLTLAGLMAFGVVYDHCQNVALRRCSITGATDSTHVTAYCGGVHAWVCDDVVIEDNLFSGNGNTVSGHLSADVQINGNGANVGSLRVKVNRNQMLSTATQYCIAAYDVQKSQFNFNIGTGAKTGAGNNNGYGILVYRQPANTGLHEENEVLGNHIYDVQGTGIYIQGSHRTRIADNTIDRSGTVQDDTSLPVAAIATNGADHITISNCGGTDNAKASICIAGTTADGFSVTGCSFTTTVSGVRHLLFRAPAVRGVFANLSFKGGASGVSTLAVDTFLDRLAFSNINIESVAARAVDLYGIARSTFANVTVKGSGGNGICLVGSAGTPTATTDNTFVNCHAWDGGTLADNTYDGFNLSRALRSKVIACTAGNVGGTGFRYGFAVDSSNTASVVRLCGSTGGRTGAFLVDATLGLDGNYDATTAYPTLWQMRQQAVLLGSAAGGTQLLLGDSSAQGTVGTRFSSADTVITHNATQVMGADTWHQPSGGNASKLIALRANGDMEFYSAPAGTADGNFATFWGTAKAAFTAASAVKLAGTQVLATRVTGYTAMTGSPDKATAYATSTVTLAQLAGRVAQLQADLTTHGIVGP